MPQRKSLPGPARSHFPAISVTLTHYNRFSFHSSASYSDNGVKQQVFILELFNDACPPK